MFSKSKLDEFKFLHLTSQIVWQVEIHLTMKATSFSGTSVNVCQTTRRHFSQDSNLHSHRNSYLSWITIFFLLSGRKNNSKICVKFNVLMEVTCCGRRGVDTLPSGPRLPTFRKNIKLGFQPFLHCRIRQNISSSFNSYQWEWRVK